MENTVTPSVTAVHNQALARPCRQPVSSTLTMPCRRTKARASSTAPRQGRGHLPFQPADGTQRHLEAEGVGQQRPDVALAQPGRPRPAGSPRLARWGPKGVPRHAFGPTGFGQAVAVSAAQGVQLILDDLGAQRRDDDFLVALRMGIVSRQPVPASVAIAGLDRDSVRPPASTDTHERPCPSCPGCPPGERPEDRRRPEASVRRVEEPDEEV